MRIVVSVSNDIVTDQRVHRICNTLTEYGFQVVLLGRKKKNSPALGNYSFPAKRFRLLFEAGPCFYACLNLRLFMFLLFTRADIFLSNDLDTLPANYLAARIRRKKLVYDSHELFTEVPELVGRERIKKVWLYFEKRILPKISYSYTVCESIARYYQHLYRVDMKIIRNLPLQKTPITDFRQRDNVIIYQGVLNKSRGLEMLINAMQFLPEVKLMIVGIGDIEVKLKNQVKEMNLTNVEFIGRVLPEQLHSITSRAILGLSLEEDLGLNYRYALPNKLFDYIQAGVPVLVSNLPEMKSIVEEYEVGEILMTPTPENLAKTIKNMLSKKEDLFEYHNNCIEASKILNWENEQVKLSQLFK